MKIKMFNYFKFSWEVQNSNLYRKIKKITCGSRDLTSSFLHPLLVFYAAVNFKGILKACCQCPSDKFYEAC